MKQILPLNPATYQRHQIHAAERNWAETNCYVDVWVELLHALGHEPIAALAFTLAIDFEGDQWTFFKFDHSELYELYGLDVQELAIWRPLTEHLEEQVDRGRHVLVELDSYYLPDTAGAAYQREHVKTTVAVNAIDVGKRVMGYFHNQSYHHVQGDDFLKIFRLDQPCDPSRLAPFCEFVKQSDRLSLAGDALVPASLGLLRARLQRLPKFNPFVPFKKRLEADLAWLSGADLAAFHQYSFATLRQFGAAFELAATYFHWLKRNNVKQTDEPIAAFQELSTLAKTLQFHLARTVTRKKPLDTSVVDKMAMCWEDAQTNLRAKFQ
jgi:hypothetical protein